MLVSSLLNMLSLINNSIPCDIQCKDYPIFQYCDCYFTCVILFTINSYRNLLHPNVRRKIHENDVPNVVVMNEFINHRQHLNFEKEVCRLIYVTSNLIEN